MDSPPLAPDAWTRREQLLGAAVAVIGAVLWFTAGLRGGLLAAAVAAVWLSAGTPYAFVVGQVGLVVFLDGGPTATPAAQIALIVFILFAATDVTDLRTTGAVFAVGAVATAALLALGETVSGTLRSGAVMLIITGIAAYAIHRYERLELGLIGGPE